MGGAGSSVKFPHQPLSYLSSEESLPYLETELLLEVSHLLITETSDLRMLVVEVLVEGLVVNLHTHTCKHTHVQTHPFTHDKTFSELYATADPPNCV